MTVWITLLMAPIAAAAVDNPPPADVPPAASTAPAATATPEAEAPSGEPGVIEIQITGIEADQRRAVLAALDIARYQTRKTIGSARLERLLREAPEQIRFALEVFGYYDARARVERTPLPDRRHRVTIAIERGEPVRITAVDVRIEGPASSEPLLIRQLEQFEPAKGAILDHRAYERGKATIERTLQRLGYFDARLLDRRVEVHRGERRASIDLRWDSGPRYRFGPATFEGAQFPDPFMARFVPWDEGAYYEQQKIEDLQQRLAAAGFFGSIEIEPQVEARADGLVPVRIAVEPAARTAWSVGAYYETNYGAGVRLGVDRRWINDRGHSARGELEVAQALQALTAEYRIPHTSVQGAQWLVGVSARNEDTDTVQARSALLRAGVLGTWNEWTGLASVNALRGSFRVGSREVSMDRSNATVVYPELSFSRVFARDRIRPTRGGSLRVTARAASESLASDLDLLQVRVEGRYVLPAGEGARLLGRAELGWTDTNRFELLPPELRFFAGGDGSVRGYAWQDLGPVDAAGEPIGGSNVATFSLEYERNFRPAWSWAAFVDGGNVFDGSDFEPAYGVGGGVRWSSPIGPIRLDLAHGFDIVDLLGKMKFL
jgi:translocation and assembly module TamA